jgi:hypothetical protein
MRRLEPLVRGEGCERAQRRGWSGLRPTSICGCVGEASERGSGDVSPECGVPCIERQSAVRQARQADSQWPAAWS